MSGMANPQPMVTLQSVKRVLARSPIQAGDARTVVAELHQADDAWPPKFRPRPVKSLRDRGSFWVGGCTRSRRSEMSPRRHTAPGVYFGSSGWLPRALGMIVSTKRGPPAWICGDGAKPGRCDQELCRESDPHSL